jgi:hypothetical protein
MATSFNLNSALKRWQHAVLENPVEADEQVISQLHRGNGIGCTFEILTEKKILPSATIYSHLLKQAHGNYQVTKGLFQSIPDEMKVADHYHYMMSEVQMGAARKVQLVSNLFDEAKAAGKANATTCLVAMSVLGRFKRPELAQKVFLEAEAKKMVDEDMRRKYNKIASH